MMRPNLEIERIREPDGLRSHHSNVQPAALEQRMDSRLISLIEQNASVLDQLGEFVAGTSQAQFNTVVDSRNGGSMGQHVRHVIEHVDALFGGFAGEVDFYHRPRDWKTETDPAEAKARLDRLAAALREMPRGSRLDEPVRVRHVIETGECAEEVVIESTLGRELLYLQSHTVHHMALIAVLAEQLSISVATDFGVAASTLRHRARTQDSTQASA